MSSERSYGCMICGTTIQDYEPVMCCNGHECGCMGQPTEPPICSAGCWDKFNAGKDTYIDPPLKDVRVVTLKVVKRITIDPIIPDEPDYL